MEELKDPLFTPSSGVQVSPKRPKFSSSSTNSTILPKYPECEAQPLGSARSQGISSDVNGSPATTVAMTTMTSQKAELMKGVVPHAVQSSQHPSLRSPVGKLIHLFIKVAHRYNTPKVLMQRIFRYSDKLPLRTCGIFFDILSHSRLMKYANKATDE